MLFLTKITSQEGTEFITEEGIKGEKKVIRTGAGEYLSKKTIKKDDGKERVRQHFKK